MLSLAGQMAWLREHDERWQPEEADAAAGWQHLPGSPNLGFTRDAIWLRLQVLQPENGASWRLEVDNTLLEDVRLHLRDATGAWQAQQAGRKLRHSDWPLDTRSPVFRLDLPPGQHELLLRLATRNSLSTSLRLWEAERFYARASNESLLWGVYFGLYGLVILIQFLFWKWTREALSGWYVLYAGLNCFGMAMTMGYLQNAMNWSGALAVPLLSLAICASLYAGTKFTLVALELNRFMPRLYRFALYGASSVAAVASLLVLGGAIALGTGTVQVVSIVWMLMMSWSSLVLLRRGEMAARFLLVAFGVFFIGILIRYLRNLGWLQPGLLTDNSVQVGSVLHMIVMCVFIVFRYNALRTALQVEQAARQEQRDFVALVSHEFRTPLAIINTSVQQLAAHLDAPVEKSLKRCTNIQAAARRMADLMDNYLIVERMDHSVQSMQIRRCDLRALLEEMVAEWPEDRVHLQAGELPAAFTCDPEMLKVALRNLLANANRHAPAATSIELTARSLRHRGLSLRVTNAGDTIPADEVPLLFQKYFRGRTTLDQPGAGLGLFLVQQIVTAHGGRISVQSALGTTTFKMWLPAWTESEFQQRSGLGLQRAQA
ncbi:sensor histidine kinase [Hydrogenophaga palleronii]|uniref:sensor histidine kinase n=1 Tax=Hydrogenophaga palleronii TaxID=65655 RepID=UPI001470A147|nr:sensor histidine kinase [Hydrogenophaga palleronii]